MSDQILTKISASRKNYFQTKGIDPYPMGQEERLLYAQSLFRNPPFDYETIFMCFDKIEDFDHPEFLRIIGDLHALSDSPYFDLKLALNFFNDSFRFSTDNDKKIYAARRYLETYSFIHSIDGNDYASLSKDHKASGYVLYLAQHGTEVQISPQAKETQRSPFMIAMLNGSGRQFERNHELSFNIYKEHILDANSGYLAASYRNIAMRHALGLGTQLHYHNGENTIRTGRLMFEDIPYAINDPLLKLLSKHLNNTRENNYWLTCHDIHDRYNRFNNAWFLKDIIDKAKESEKSAILTMSGIFAALSIGEDWKDAEDWKYVYEYALTKFNSYTPDNLSILNSRLSLTTQRFHPKMLEQEPQRFRLKDQRLNMYEYFRGNNLGIPPIDQNERYKLALSFCKKSYPDYEATYVLYDPEEDSKHADWLLLIGHIYDVHPQRKNHHQALRYYISSSNLGNGEASYRAGQKYEQGDVTKINLDYALEYYKLAKDRGFHKAQFAIDHIQGFVSEIDKETKNKSIRQDFFDLFSYFRKHGLGFPPVSTKDRLKYAGSRADIIPPDYSMTFKLYFPSLDSQNSDWLLLIGYIYNDETSSYFDPEASLNFYKKSSDLGNSAASRNIGLKYEYGKETPVDLDEALRWYNLSLKQGNLGAYQLIADINLLQESLHNPSADVRPDRYIFSLYKESIETLTTNAMFSYIKCLINGDGTEKDIETALKSYKFSLSQTPGHQDKPYHAMMAYNFAIRNFLGLDMPQSISEAVSYLEMIPKKSNFKNISINLNRKKTDLLKAIDEQRRGDISQEVNLLRRLYKNPDLIATTISEVSNGKVVVSKNLIKFLHHIEYLAATEDWPSRYDWDDLIEAAQSRQLGLTFEQVSKSTFNSGPRYTPLDHRGLPVLGVLPGPSPDEDTVQRLKRQTGSYVPQSGITVIRGIAGNQNGFHYDALVDYDRPALIVPEDLDVAEVLIFGDTDGPLLPSLSLEQENNDNYGRGSDGGGQDSRISYKIWSPSWLGHTDFGKTLYITDDMIGQWCWAPERYKVGEPEYTFHPSVSYMARDFVKDIRLTGGRNVAGGSARVMIQPKHVFVTPPEPTGTVYVQESAAVSIKQVTMKVYGSYIINENGSENRSAFEEDPNFEQGRKVQKLTERYNDIALLDPRFDRAKQLMGLLYGMLRLRQIGYRPPEDLQRHLRNRLSEFERMGKVPMEDLVQRRSYGRKPYATPSLQ